MVDPVALRARLERQSDDALTTMLLYERGDYTDEALALAEELLAARGRDLAAVRRKLAAGAKRERRHHDDEARRAAEAAAEIVALGREPGTCLRCRRRPPVVERWVAALRAHGRSERVADLELQPLTRLRLAIPLCDDCERQLRPRFVVRGAFVWGWLVGSMALGIALAFGAGAAFPGLDPRLAVTAGMAVAALSIFAPLGLSRRAARRMGQLHPSAASLKRAGFVLRPDDPVHAGSTPLDTYAALLGDFDRDKRVFAERRLSAMNSRQTIARMRSLLAHERAAEHAVRVLVALRAVQAADDLARAARGPDARVADEACAALRALGRADLVPADDERRGDGAR